ncbi:LOW QUALITY PROTEIN: glutamate receptor 2.6-like [Silene latifolia]|uniref:LOW QUALITY PROTEIN: glutamate receptor 2.6-like n=1 Tax=Silene latifolia TaxID=37657 RepID=UPI003D76C2C1
MKIRMFKGLWMLLLLWIVATTWATEDGKVVVNVGVIYDENDELGKMGLNSIQMAFSDFYNSHGDYNTRIALHTKLYPSKDSIVGAASAALYLLKYKQVKAIIGPTTLMDAEFVIKLGDKAQVPILSYSSTSPCVSSGQCPYFVSVAPKDSLQVQAITALVKANNWTYVIPIYADNIEYEAGGIIPYLDDALQKINARIPFHEAISSTSTDAHILQLLQKLKAKQTRVFVVHLYPDLASRLFLLANELKMMGRGYVWITTTSTSNELGSLDENIFDSMQGVVGVQTYIPETNELKRFKTQGTNKLSVMGLRAYDVAWALARVVEQVADDPNSGIKTTLFMTGNITDITDLDRLGVSPVGPRLIKALYNTRFSGLAGNFSLSNGQSPIYRIINVFGSGSRGVGFWTSEKGLVPNLNPGDKNTAGLRPIIWPGDATSPPRGLLEIPVSGNKFRVGVPGKAVFKQLVNVTLVKGTSDTPENVTGFCIDIFESVMKNLGYSGHYDYHPFENPLYDDLVHQVYLQKYDIVVGDISIIANRTSWVDFTLPFTESGVTMVVPVKDDKKSAWVFLKPLTWELWVATLCTFVFIAFAIWVLEHRINEEFRGPPLHQVGTSLFYSFSMMVFAQRENVLSNLSRCVVVVWVFVVLVLTQSYTASLTSMLIIHDLSQPVDGVDELQRSGANVSYQDGTFVRDLLIKKGFNQSKLISYNSSKNLHEFLSKGEIKFVFDEIPYMRLFIALHPSKYLMMQPLYKTDGFGFAFPKGSHLAPMVSAEILNVIEGDQMVEFEKKWGMQSYNSSYREI